MKRFFDICLALFGILSSLPLWMLISFAIWLEDRGPIFYTQDRVGKDRKTFKIYKFRSMIKDAEKHTGPVWAAENDPRITKVGKILRATAMDELPQLLNIFKGDMSFVGPRAERPEMIAQFGERIPKYNLRFQAKPGLTGIAQIFGRYDTPPQHKLRYDLFYIENQSFWLDLKLILLSFWITFRGKWGHKEKKI